MKRRPLPNALRAFSHRDFRLFFGGHFLSLIGTWMQRVAMGWLVYRLTGSALALGAVGFASQFPSFLIAPFAGVLVDRWSRRRIVLATQIVALAQGALLAALTLAGVIQVWHIMVLAVALGAANGFDIPARQAFLVELVEGTEDLANAIALNSSMFNAARLIGPALAGLLIGLVGEGWVFLLNAASYAAIIVALLRIGIGAPAVQTGRVAMIRNLAEGWRYALGFAPIRAVLALLALVSLVGLPYAVLLPVFARDRLGGDAQTLGLLMSGAGLGALTSALYLANRHTVRGLGRVIVAGGSLFGAALIVFATSTLTWLSTLMMFLVGGGLMVMTASINTVLQTLVDEDKRGRVMSLYTMAFMGMAPFGSLLAGAVADRVGVVPTVAAGGAACIMAAALFARAIPRLRPLVHPIYIRKGILPEVATGLGAATELRARR